MASKMTISVERGAGQEPVTISATGTVRDVLKALGINGDMSASVNGQPADEAAPLRDGDRVALCATAPKAGV